MATKKKPKPAETELSDLVPPLAVAPPKAVDDDLGHLAVVAGDVEELEDDDDDDDIDENELDHDDDGDGPDEPLENELSAPREGAAPRGGISLLSPAQRVPRMSAPPRRAPPRARAPLAGAFARAQGAGAGPGAPLAFPAVATPEQRRRQGEFADNVSKNLDDVLANLNYKPDEISISVARVEPDRDAMGNKCDGHLRTYTGPVTVEQLQQHHGGGRYRCMITAKDPAGRSKIVNTVIVDIAGQPKLANGALPFNGMGFRSAESTDLAKTVIEHKDRDVVRLSNTVAELQTKLLAKETSKDSLQADLLKLVVGKPDDTKTWLLEREKLELQREETRRREEEQKRDKEEQRRLAAEEKRHREEMTQRQIEENRRRDEENRRREEDNKRREEERERRRAEEQQSMQSFTAMMQMMQQQAAAQQQAQQQAMQMQMQQMQLMMTQSQQSTQLMVQMMASQGQQKDALVAQMMTLATQNNGKSGLSGVLGELSAVRDFFDSGGGGGGDDGGVLGTIKETAKAIGPGLLTAFMPAAGALAPAAAQPAAASPAPAAPEVPQIGPGAMAVAPLPPSAITPAQRAKQQAALRAVKKEQVMTKAKETAKEIVLPDDFKFPSEKMNLVDSVQLLAIDLEIALRKDMTAQQTWDQVVTKFPPTVVGMLKMLSKDQILEGLNKSAPPEWMLVSIKGERMVEDLLNIAKKS